MTTLRPPCDEGVVLAARPCPPRQGAWVLAATILGSSMAFIDGTAVNVALPALQRDLGATVGDVQWVVEAYALLLAALILVGGALGDRYGRRALFTAGVALFALSSAACGLAPGIGWLIAARVAQGASAALLVPGSLAILSASFPPESRGRAIGTWSAFTGVTAAVGPLVGGWLVDHASWRWVFFLNLPFAAAVLALSAWKVPESRDPGAASRLDWAGAALATLGLGGLTYGLIELPERGAVGASALLALAAGTAALAGFVLVEARSPAPMMPLGLFRSRTFAGANLLTFCLYAALGGALFFLPFNLIQVQRYSAAAAGAALLPFVLLMFLLSRWAGGLVDRYGSRLPLVVGPAVAAAGLALFALPGVGAGYWSSFFPAVMVLGLGMAVSVAPLTTTVMGAVDTRHAGLASGINNAVARVASLLAVAAFGLAVLGAFEHGLEQRLARLDLPASARQAIAAQSHRLAAIEVPRELDGAARARVQRAVAESFVDGFRLTMSIGAGLALLAAAAAARMIEGAARRGGPAEP
ncbi:MAG TPA: MFS transporter [Thermoanaerobaculia bacterium]|nr:MFS transporter [Thermoanaerobaculia bacterium]